MERVSCRRATTSEREHARYLAAVRASACCALSARFCTVMCGFALATRLSPTGTWFIGPLVRPLITMSVLSCCSTDSDTVMPSRYLQGVQLSEH